MDPRSAFAKHLGVFGETFADGWTPLLHTEERLAPLTSTESGAIAYSKPKTAALCFDRVWNRMHTGIPRAVGFYAGTQSELALSLVVELVGLLQTLEVEEPDKAQWLYKRALRISADLYPQFVGQGLPASDQLSRFIAEGISAETGRRVIPVYQTVTAQETEYRPGDRAAVVAVLENVPVVVEESLTWEQVLELRRDAEMLQKFRKFVHWLDAEMSGRPISYVADEIAVRMDDYSKAVRKHGLATKLGLLQITAEAAILGGGSAAAMQLAPSAAAHGPEWAFCVGASIVGARAAVHIARALFDLRSARDASAGEIAYVVQLQRTMTAA